MNTAEKIPLPSSPNSDNDENLLKRKFNVVQELRGLLQSSELFSEKLNKLKKKLTASGDTLEEHRNKKWEGFFRTETYGSKVKEKIFKAIQLVEKDFDPQHQETSTQGDDGETNSPRPEK